MNESILYRLKSLVDHNIISIYKNQFKIGRATTNDLAIENNRYISSTHCIFEFDNGHVYIRDTSSNGTLINRSKKINKNDSPIELQSNDIIHLVFRKDEPNSNVIYQLDLPSIIKQTEQKLKRKYSETKENTDLTLINSNTDIEMKRVKTNEDLAINASDDMEHVLTCVCCQDIMSNPISLEPCLHAFCSDCYGSWEAIQRTCPQCRVKVTGKKKNVVINGILEAFLKAHPDKRPVLKPIDNTACKIKTTNEITRNVINDHDEEVTDEDEDDEEVDEEEEDDDEEIDDDDDEEGDDEDDDEEGDDDDDDHFTPMMTNPVPDVRFACRQCPPVGRAHSSTISTEFQCHSGQNHILCQCCVQPMPDRRNEPNIHQNCEICHQYFCNVYFRQCQGQGCLGCLNQLRNFNFSPRHLTNLVNDNPIETQIVQNYLSARRLTMRDLFLECCQRLDRKEFKCTGIDRNIAVPSKKIVCYKCGLNMFKELAYQFRVAMKMNDIIPAAMRNREDCYYGKQCRTQYTKPGHAQKLNHACEQTRFEI